MVETAARYQAHPAPGSVAELEALYAWLDDEREQHEDAGGTGADWHRQMLEGALGLVYRAIVARAPKANDYGPELVSRALINGRYRLVESRCEDPICPAEHDVDGRHHESART